MPVLVTGGAGFIGSHLVDELMTQGYEVRVIDNLSEGKEENFARWKRDEKFQFIKGDIRDAGLVERMADQCSTVFHLAGCSRIQPSITDPMVAFSSNFMGTANVAEACRKAGVKRLVYSASSSAYGRHNDWALSATESQGLYETLPTECLNPYSLSKKVGEEIVDLYQKLYGLSTVSLRYFNVYGPRHQEEGSYSTVIAVFRKQLRHGKKMTIVGDGTQRRDFTFVGDVVRANMMAMMNREVTGTINIGTGKNYSINELAGMVLASTGAASLTDDRVEYIAPRQGEANITLADRRKAYAELGWEPNVNLEQGLQVVEDYERRFGVGGLIMAGR